jgi:hypothetical protein
MTEMDPELREFLARFRAELQENIRVLRQTRLENERVLALLARR